MSQNLVEEIGAKDESFFFASLFTYAKGEQVKGGISLLGRRLL